MKKLILSVVLCCAFGSINRLIPNCSADNIDASITLRILVENDTEDIKKIIRDCSAEACRATVKAAEAHFKARVKDAQSYKVYVTKADVLKMCSVEAGKARVEADKAYREFIAARSAHDSTTKDKDTKSSASDIADANAAKTYGILCKIAAEITKSNINKAIKLYNIAAEFYDKAARAYGKIVAACSINTPIIRTAEKARGTGSYTKYRSDISKTFEASYEKTKAEYEIYIAEKEKAAETWAKHEAYFKKMKKIAEAYAKAAAISIELYEAAENYANAAEDYAKVTNSYAKAAASSTEVSGIDKSSKSDTAFELLHEARNKTMKAFATYCRTKLKLAEAKALLCSEEAEELKLKTELSKASVEQSINDVQHQAASFSVYQ